ncbi:hypothetical protein ATANTOWER_018322 [Ataeniobius toweri]|uniref:Uncharacterized protein n=1 Tax=Ataeniobius toweri TaxID=208326 RepID=A0ABU7CBC6_9TELE|nr:hypothetical protein [Ataeniobius toweri]
MTVGDLEQHWRKRNEEQKRHIIGEHHLDGELPDTFDLQTPASLEVPTRSNVVYITLKFKRLQPQHIRGCLGSIGQYLQ